VKPASIMFYCHDSYGLGHVRRTLTLGRFLRGRWPELTQLIVTGSPFAHHFLLPDDADYVKLPSVSKVDPDRFVSRSLDVDFDELLDLRADLILTSARHFRPGILLVDHLPAGLRGEVAPTLRYLKQTGCKLVAGLRDISGDPEQVRRDWARDGVYDLLDELYDLLLVYGDESVHDVIHAYGLSRRAAAKTRYVGYLRRDAGERPASELRADLGLVTGRLVLVTVGGGGDGYPLLRTLVDALHGCSQPRFDCLLVGGSLLPEADRRALKRALPRSYPVRFIDFLGELAGYVAAADAVVSMGGYNSVCEILSFRRPALVVPRVFPSREQLIRAEALSRRGLLRMLHPSELTGEALLAEIDGLLARPPRPALLPALDGLSAAADELGKLLARDRTRVLA
jgi:predicted glycosyltransferase